jgi:hypothetical protein
MQIDRHRMDKVHHAGQPQVSALPPFRNADRPPIPVSAAEITTTSAVCPRSTGSFTVINRTRLPPTNASDKRLRR